MKCPHCLVDFHEQWSTDKLGDDASGTNWTVSSTFCPACRRIIIFILNQYRAGNGNKLNMMVYPRGISRTPLAASVTLNDSPKASAALSRRCLQNILRDVAKVKKSDLSKEIDEVLLQNNSPLI